MWQRILWSCVWFLLGGVAAAAAHNGKNVILIVVDDMGFQAGCYGDQLIQTPGLDRLAATGTRFTRAGCTTASCSASRSVLMTGLHNHATGHYGHAHAYHHALTRPSVRLAVESVQGEKCLQSAVCCPIATRSAS